MKLLLRFLFLVLVVSASIFYFLHSDNQATANVRNSTSSSNASQQTSQAGWDLQDAPAASQLIDPKAQIKG
jgi:uncharacterized protein (UPF0333 family)